MADFEAWIGVDGKPEKESYLTITEHEFEPLPDQSGIPFWDQDWIAPELKDLLFGQSDGGLPLRTYFIVDATLRKNITGIFDLDAVDVPVECLFKGEAAEELREVAPYLINMTLPEGAWGDKDKVPAFHQDFFKKHWEQNTGVFIRSTASMDKVWGHFRKFTRVSDKNNKIVYFRFWVPSTLYPMGRYLRHSDQYAHVFLPEHVDSLLFKHPDKERVLEQKAVEPRRQHRQLIIEKELEDYFISYAGYTHIMRLMRDIDALLLEKEPDLKEAIGKTPKSRKFSIAKNLYRLKILDVVQAAAITSIIYRTGINVLTEKAFNYATKNPLLSPSAKARQITLAFVMVGKMSGDK